LVLHINYKLICQRTMSKKQHNVAGGSHHTGRRIAWLRLSSPGRRGSLPTLAATARPTSL
jgi:hypothetical protein